MDDIPPSLAPSISAMDQMAGSIRRAKSYQCKVSVRFKGDENGGRSDVDGAAYWLAPGTVRTEMTFVEDVWEGPGPEQVDIQPLRKPGLHVFHPTKTFWYLPIRQEAALASGTDDIARLAEFSGKADRELGSKEIDGSLARGYIVDIARISGSFYSGEAEMWLSDESNLPLLIRYDATGPGFSFVQEISDIKWNCDLEPRLFSVTPPTGYIDRRPAALPQEQIAQVVAALEVSVEAFGGRYPTEVLGAGVVDDLCRRFGLTQWPKRDEMHGNAGKVAKVLRGFDHIMRPDVEKQEVAYYGKSVGPSDLNEVLLRWRLADGRDAIIHGDLRSQIATEARYASP